MNWEYLAGFIDGEGSISIFRGHLNSKFPHLTNRITIPNTDKRIIRLICEFLKSNEINFCVTYRSEDNPNHKAGIVIMISEIDSLLKICSKLRGRLIIKAQHLELLIRYLKLRKKKLDKTQWRRDLARYGRREFNLFYQLRILNKKGPDAQKTI